LNDSAIIKEMRAGFANIESRLDQIYDHVDGFMKLHETRDIELKIMQDAV